MFRVTELFPTIQGEGRFTGEPSTFIRLQGCDVGCPWCDTKHTWDFEGPAADMVLDELVVRCREADQRHVVITGGEPCAQDLHPLTSTLIGNGHTVQIETSGTYEVHVHRETWVTCSPKFSMPGGREVRDDALRRADEIKLVVGKAADVDRALQLLNYGPVWLQPLSQNQKATDLCVQACLEHGFRLSVQTHKYIGVD